MRAHHLLDLKIDERQLRTTMWMSEFDLEVIQARLWVCTGSKMMQRSALGRRVIETRGTLHASCEVGGAVIAWL